MHRGAGKGAVASGVIGTGVTGELKIPAEVSVIGSRVTVEAGLANGKIVSTNWTCLETYIRPDSFSKHKYALWLKE